MSEYGFTVSRIRFQIYLHGGFSRRAKGRSVDRSDGEKHDIKTK